MAKSKTSWKKGKSGNPAGRPKKGNALAEILDDGLSRKVKAGTRNRVIVNRLFDLALSPDADLSLKAISKIFDISQRNYEFNKKMEIENRITEIEERLNI